MNTSIVKTVTRLCTALALTAALAAPHAAKAQNASVSYASGPSYYFTSDTLNSGSAAGAMTPVVLYGAGAGKSAVAFPSATSFEIGTTNKSGDGTFEFFNGNTDVLSGTFTGYNITDVNVKGQGIGSAQFGLGSVDYTGGSYLSLMGLTSATGTGGGSFSNVTGCDKDGYVGSVEAGTFDMNINTLATPEPSGLVIFGVLGLGMLGAVMLRRKRASDINA